MIMLGYLSLLMVFRPFQSKIKFIIALVIEFAILVSFISAFILSLNVFDIDKKKKLGKGMSYSSILYLFLLIIYLN